MNRHQSLTHSSFDQSHADSFLMQLSYVSELMSQRLNDYLHVAFAITHL